MNKLTCHRSPFQQQQWVLPFPNYFHSRHESQTKTDHPEQLCMTLHRLQLSVLPIGDFGGSLICVTGTRCRFAGASFVLLPSETGSPKVCVFISRKRRSGSVFQKDFRSRNG